MIIDCHVHPTSPPERMLHYADRMGIDKLCLSLGPQLAQQPAPEEIEADNDFNRRLVELHPDRFLAYANLNPNYLEHSLGEMERCIVNGPFMGVKLWVAMRCDQPNVEVIAERAGELGAPILQHTFYRTGGNMPGESQPDELARLADRHPETTFSAAHAGLNWEKGLKAVIEQENLLVDTCGFDPEMGYTEMAVRLLGVERVVYGSDGAGRSFASQLAKVYGADISDDEKAAILGGNMRRVLGL